MITEQRPKWWKRVLAWAMGCLAPDDWRGATVVVTGGTEAEPILLHDLWLRSRTLQDHGRLQVGTKGEPGYVRLDNEAFDRTLERVDIINGTGWFPHRLICAAHREPPPLTSFGPPIWAENITSASRS